LNQPNRISARLSAVRDSFWRRVRNTFLAGIAVLLPLAITLWLISLIYGFLNDPFSSLLETVSAWLGANPKSGESTTKAGALLLKLSKWPGLGLLVTLILVMVAGALARNLLGKHLIRWIDESAGRLPVIRGIYNSVKQLSDTIFASTGKQSFRRAVLVRFPTDSSFALAFVTGEARPPTEGGAPAAPAGMLNVFVPTTPNPTSGFLLLVPASKTIALEISVEDAMKMVISAGMYTPEGIPGDPGAAPAANRADG
jgi:uncharacterized membrane protein